MAAVQQSRAVPDWDELVTTALLGTDRRPVVTATELLGDAARHRAATRCAAALQRCSAAPTGPEPELPWAPPPAQELLDALLARPVAELVNAWLAAAVQARVLLAPQHWTPLAGLASTRPDYDRRLLAAVVGPVGCWFLEQNPAWRRLAAGVRDHLTPRSPQAPSTDTPDPTGGSGALPGEAEVRARPDAALEVPGPWPRSLTIAALRALLSGQLGWRAAGYGSALGARLALPDADLLQQADDALPGEGRGAPPGVRLVRDALAAATRSVEARDEIAGVFAPLPPTPKSSEPSSEDPDGRA